VNKYFIFVCSMLLCTNVFAITLTKGVPVTGLSAATGNLVSYEIIVPSGATNLVISSSSGSGDADLYVKAGSAPTTSSYNCRPYLAGNNESCSFATPQTTTYFIQLRAYASFSGVTLTANYTASSVSSSSSRSSATQLLNNGDTRSNLSGVAGSATLFQLSVPAGATDLAVIISGGSGDVDLFVRFGQAPTTSAYDCRPYVSGNNENCTFAVPQAGTYYILLSGYSAFSGLSLNVSYTNGGGTSGATWSGFQTYYADVIGLSGSTLKNGLATSAARNHSRMTYDQVWDALKYTDEDPNNPNNVILIYTGRSQAKTFNSSGNSDPDAWNREHTWPKSHGFPDTGDWAYSDIHHLRPEDASVNSTRGNKDFDNGGSTIGEAAGNYTDGDSFEPRNQVKGDIARIMFYMEVRYNGGDSTGTEDLTLVNFTGTSGASLGKICTLLAWHNQDPASQEEINRHARIVSRQGNRNPFVDYPAWANQIWGSTCP
jgi:endonuclease I